MCTFGWCALHISSKLSYVLLGHLQYIFMTPTVFGQFLKQGVCKPHWNCETGLPLADVFLMQMFQAKSCKMFSTKQCCRKSSNIIVDSWSRNAGSSYDFPNVSDSFTTKYTFRNGIYACSDMCKALFATICLTSKIVFERHLCHWTLKLRSAFHFTGF